MPGMAFVPKAFVRLSHRLARWSADHMPRRKMRKWRYVSPRRHLIGLLLLSGLLGATYGYWALTNDASVRRTASEYLEKLTGARVTVGEAHFELFGGIRLRNVSAYLSDDDTEPFFRAPEIVLRHQPWALLGGKLHVTEVVLVDPEIVNEHDLATGSYGHERLFAGDRSANLAEKHLPSITVHNVLYRQVEVRGSIRAEGEVTPRNAVCLPTADKAYYEIYAFEPKDEPPAPGETPRRETQWARMDMRTGKVELLAASVRTDTLAVLVGGEFAKWEEEYQIGGYFDYVSDDNQQADGVRRFTLVDGSMSLPTDQGGLSLSSVHGGMTYVPDKEGGRQTLIFRDVTGRLPQCGEATFTLTGQAELGGETPTYDVDIVIENMSVPETNPASGAVGETIDSLLAEYGPAGAMDIALHVARNADGEMTRSGTIRPLGMDVTHKHFPALVTDVTGTIYFDREGLYDIDLSGRRGEGGVTVRGEARRGPRVWLYDLMIDTVGSPLDEETRNALPERFAAVWDSLQPTGQANARVHISRDEHEQRDLTVELDLKRQAGITYEKFPYPLEGLVGRVSISDGRVHIDRTTPVTGGNGRTKCTIYGDIVDIGKPSAMTDLKIDIWRMSLDEQLLSALPARAAEVIDSVGLTCFAPRVQARIVDAPGEPLDFSVQADVTDVAFTLDELPQPVTKGTGEVTIEPDRVIIKHLKAACGPTTVNLSGQVFINDDSVGYDISLDAATLEVDEELLAALPADVQAVARQFSPSGTTGVSVWLQRNVPGSPAGDYRVVLTPQDMTVRYEGFPYPFTCVGGTVAVTPGLARLTGLTAREGDMSVTIDGTVEYGSGLRGREMSVTARNVPIDEDFLAAVPGDMASLAQRFTPGGVCNIDITRLDFRRADPAGDGGAAAPLLWYAEGTFGVADAVVSLGLGDKALSGRLVGKLGRNADGLAIKGDLLFDSIHIGQRELTDVQCQITKAYASTMLHLDDFIGHTHGGRVSEGFAEIDLTDPLAYGIRLSVENVDLNSLLNAGVTDPDDLSDITGRLAGRLELIATADDPQDRRASGVLLIEQASMVHMPVLLGMMNVITLKLPGDAMFTDGIMSYRLNGNTLTFEEIHLTGPTLGIVGSGTMDMQTEELKLTFLGGPPTQVPRLLGLEELVEHVVREIVEIEISGTLSEPVTRTVPLRGIEDVISRLLRPGEQ